MTSTLSQKEPQDLVAQGQVSSEEMLHDFESIVIKALKLGLQLQLQQMITSECNLIKILTQKSSQEALDANFAATFVPQPNENGFILDKLKNFKQILAHSTYLRVHSSPPTSSIQRSELSAPGVLPTKNDLVKSQMEQQIISSIQNVIEIVIKKATANLQTGSKNQQMKEKMRKLDDDDDAEQQVLDIGEMNLQFTNDLNDPNLSCHVNVKRDLHNESNLIMEEFHHLNQSTQVNADGGHLTLLDGQPSKVQDQTFASKNDPNLSVDKPEKHSGDDQKIEYTEDIHQITEVTSSQIFMENSNIIDMSKMPKSVAKHGQGHQQQINERKLVGESKRSYLIRQIYSSYDQYYDHGQKFKQIESLLGKRRVNDRLDQQPFQRTLRSSRQMRKHVHLSQLSKSSTVSKQIQQSNQNNKITKAVASLQIQFNKNIKFIDSKSNCNKFQKQKLQQENSQDSKLAVASVHSSENKAEQSQREGRARRAEKREQKRNQKIIELQAKQFASYACAQNYNNNQNKDQLDQNVTQEKIVSEQKGALECAHSSNSEHVQLQTSQIEANNKTKHNLHHYAVIEIQPTMKTEHVIVSAKLQANITATTSNKEINGQNREDQKALTAPVATPVIEPSLKADVKFGHGGIPEFQTLDVTTNKICEQVDERASKDSSDEKDVTDEHELSPENGDKLHVDKTGKEAVKDLLHNEAGVSQLKEGNLHDCFPSIDQRQQTQIVNESYNCRLFENEDILEQVESFQEFKPLIDEDPQSQHNLKNSTSKLALINLKSNQQ